MKYWVNTICLDHVQRGIWGGFTQANHGKPQALRRLSRGDWLVFYSPKTTYPDGAPLQEFTALGQITDDKPYQVEMTPDFHPFRRNMQFSNSQPMPIRPLINDLLFIIDKTHWGYKFRTGLFEVPEPDFKKIADAMSIKF